ncbi:MAG: lauroyl acyltransferase [Pseudomonadota bacterium]|nr:lauroyl acyltransferase [Pseudomonadota bacterium]
MAKLFLGDKHTDHSPRVLQLLWATETGLITLLGGLSRLLSPDLASSAGRRLMRRLGPRMDKTRHIRRNLNIAFPEKTAADIDELVRDLWANLGSLLAEYPHLGTICHREAEQHLECVIRGDPQVFRKTGRPAVFVSAHLANWELAAGAIAHLGIPLTVVYTQLQNPHLDRMLFRARQSLGCGLVERGGAGRQLIRCLKQGTSVGLIVDQRVDSGEPVPFFGRDMLTSITPAQLALRFDCELIPVQVQRLEGARFRVIFHESVKPDDETADKPSKALQMTRKVNVLFESWIRERPQEWMCAKRRWPKDRQKQV